MNPPTSHGRARRPSPGTGHAARGAAAGAVLLLLPLVALTGSERFRTALDHTTGVLCLVALTCSIVWGLVASDRLFLAPRQRLLAQAVHRATALASLGFLLLHGTVKLALDHVSAVGALIPFGLGVTGTDGLIGFGSLAGLLLITTGVTGALRSSFASPARIAGRWRTLHMLAYPAWCSALVHGLYAGRAPASWVVALYCLCLTGVTAALALRAAPPRIKRRVAVRVLALLTPREPAAHAEPPPVPHRTGPLPGMITLPQPAPTRRGLPAPQDRAPRSYEERPRRSYEERRPYGEQAPWSYEEQSHTSHEEHSHASYEPPRPYEEHPRAGGGRMAAAYRVVSSAPAGRPVPLPPEQPGRWPAPSPPPPGEAARPPASPPSSPFTPPAPGEPWSAPAPGDPWSAPAPGAASSTGGRR
ncbi:hypothetical protein [Streptomyces sp. KLOTTS4A1]|uniref:hypothetical protein n=1 Tax=Streptomyces sp. KLOTTS4A1 TaxID=3390996 RepID=UPI0039F635B7